MFLKMGSLLMSIITFKIKAHSFDADNKYILLIKKNIRSEVLFLIFNILLGFIFSIFVIISFLQMCNAIHLYLLQFENNYLIESFVFFILMLISFITLYFKFNKKLIPPDHHSENKTLDLILDEVQILESQFASGFNKGLKKIKSF